MRRSATLLRWAVLGLLACLASPVLGQTAPARNVIVMISDGGGFNAFRAASFYEHGQLGLQPYDSFPVQLGCTTYMLNYVDAGGRVLSQRSGLPSNAVSAVPQGYDPDLFWNSLSGARPADYFSDVTATSSGDMENRFRDYTDSAAAATAIWSGTKTTDGRVNVSWDGQQPLQTLSEIAAAAGRATGTVTSVTVSHGTPAGFGARTPDRDDYAGIFNQMLDGDLDVIMGAGHPAYDDDHSPIAEPSRFHYVGGADTWADLSDGDGLNGFAFIDSRADFEALADGTAPVPAKLVGIPQVYHSLQYDRPHGAGRDTVNPGDDSAGDLRNDVPTLTTMTQAALRVLEQDPDGFVLQVEGGAIDWAGHDGDAVRLVEEQIEFNHAVQAVMDWVSTHGGWDQTLLIVTADHETGQLWGSGTYSDLDGDGLYNQYRDKFGAMLPVADAGAGALPAMQFASASHTNALVPLYAIGAGAEAFYSLVDGTDPMAGVLWGGASGWDGRYVDNTDIFTVLAAQMQVPEPSTALLLLAGLALRARRRA